MRSSLVFLAVLLAACTPRGTAPDSVEVGGQCGGMGVNPCDEICVTGLDTCTFTCTMNDDCPRGSVCTAFYLTSTHQNFCLPLCSWGAGCGAYAQGLCCASARSANLSGATFDVCLKPEVFESVSCHAASGADAGAVGQKPFRYSCSNLAESVCADYFMDPSSVGSCVGDKSEAACPTGASVGDCLRVNPDMEERKHYYLARWSVETATKDCTATGGTFTPR
ncbi:MAG: hypothetical protein QM765_26535 [Myxococcales bacterium]